MIVSIDKLEEVEKLLEKLGLSYKRIFVTNEEFVKDICIEDLIEEQAKEGVDVYLVVITDKRGIIEPFRKFLIEEKGRKRKNNLT